LIAGAGVAALTAGLLFAASPASATTTSGDEPSTPDGGVLSSTLLRAESAAGSTSGVIDPTLGLVADDQGRIGVSVDFDSIEARDAAQDAVAALGTIDDVTEAVPGIILAASTDRFDALAALPGVISVSPISPARPAGSASAAIAAAAAAAAPGVAADSCNPLAVEADSPLNLNSGAAKEAFGVDGTGVTVGIISDSFNQLSGPLTTWADDVAAGALPGATNPCGYTTDVVVYQDGSDLGAGTSDEGRAMAQLVHGVAPGAKLLFSTAGATEASFADNIRALQGLGADIIVDDYRIPTEPFFQEGVVSAAVRDVVDDGVLYLSAAQNEGSLGAKSTPEKTRHNENENIGSWQTDRYSAMDCPASVQPIANDLIGEPVEIDCQNFGTDDATNPYLAMELAIARPAGALVMQWTEPAFGVTSSFLLLAFDDAATPVAFLQNPSSGYPSRPWAQSVFLRLAPDVSQVSADYNFVVVRVKNTPTLETPGIKIVSLLDDAGVLDIGDGTPWPDGVTVGPTITGHPGDESVLTLGAASVLTPDTLETYSGLGPVKYLFEPMGTGNTPSAPIADPVTRSKPDVTSVDASLTTFFPNSPVGNLRFQGTSAATPNAGAVAALALQYAPSATPAQVRHALVSTASPMPAQVGDYRFSAQNVVGSGRIDAYAALASLSELHPVPAVPADTGKNRLADTGIGAAGGALDLMLIVLAGGAVLAGIRLIARRRRV
jgi:hypothetical protein